MLEKYILEEVHQHIIRILNLKIFQKRLKRIFLISKNLDDWTVEIDPRRVDVNKILFYKKCG